MYGRDGSQQAMSQVNFCCKNFWQLIRKEFVLILWTLRWEILFKLKFSYCHSSNNAGTRNVQKSLKILSSNLKLFNLIVITSKQSSISQYRLYGSAFLYLPIQRCQDKMVMHRWTKEILTFSFNYHIFNLDGASKWKLAKDSLQMSTRNYLQQWLSKCKTK